MSGAVARTAQQKQIGARVVPVEEFERAEALLRAYPRLHRGAAGGSHRLDTILSTPKVDAGPRGQGRHSDPTASRAAKLMRQEEQARICRVIDTALDSLRVDQRDTVLAYLIDRSASLPEIARTAGVSCTTVIKRRDRAVLAVMDAVREEFGRVMSPAG